MIPLQAVPTASIKNPALVYYPTHRWRDDFVEVAEHMPEKSFVSLDGKTIIPWQFDIARSVQLSAVVPGQKFCVSCGAPVVGFGTTPVQQAQPAQNVATNVTNVQGEATTEK